MHISEFKNLFENSGFKSALIKKQNVFQFEGFLSKDLPFFWDAVGPQSKQFYLFGKKYFDNKMFTVVMFKTKEHYHIAYSDDIHNTNSDLVSVPIDKFESYLETIFDLEIRCTITHEGKKEEFHKTLEQFLNYSRK